MNKQTNKNTNTLGHKVAKMFKKNMTAIENTKKLRQSLLHMKNIFSSIVSTDKQMRLFHS